MKYRMVFRVMVDSGQLSYRSYCTVRRYSWKGFRYVSFRKFLPSEFRLGIKLPNASSAGRSHGGINDTKHTAPVGQNLRSIMKIREIISVAWRLAKNYGYFSLPKRRAPQVFHAGIAPKIKDLQPKTERVTGVSTNNNKDPAPTSTQPSDHESYAVQQDVQQAVEAEAKVESLKKVDVPPAESVKPAKPAESAESAEPAEPAEPSRLDKDPLQNSDNIHRKIMAFTESYKVPSCSRGKVIGITDGVLVYAKQIPQFLTSFAASLGWPSNGIRISDISTDVPLDKPVRMTPVAQPKEEKKGQEVDSRKDKSLKDKEADHVPSWRKSHKAVWVSSEASTSRTRYLIRAVATAQTPASQATRIQDLCKHLVDNPQAKSLAVKERAIPLMLRVRAVSVPSNKGYINEALALLGYIAPLPGRGVRILTIDGGGTRGIMAVEILRVFEKLTNQPVHKLFDFICGVSTGAILSVLLGALKVSMDECELMYMKTSTEIFNQNTWLGTSKLVFNHAFYDTDAWVKVLQKNIGDLPFIHTSRDPNCPKIAVVSTIVNEPRLRAFLFRNYEYPHRHQSQFPGSSTPHLWEAVRASAAAPGYFEEYKLGDYVHQDGGILTNNPSALAIHECRHLWPGELIQCVISLGNGRYEPHIPANVSGSSLKTKLLKIVDSATDTEGVHMILNDLLPPKRYYRFNPYLSTDFSLDEIRPEKFRVLQNDARMYIRKNEHKLREAAIQLLETKSIYQKVRHTLKEKFKTYL